MRAFNLCGFLSAAIALAACAGDPDHIDSTQEELGNSELNNLPRHFPTNVNERALGSARASGSNLIYHNGPVIKSAHVVAIFWGSEWGTASAPSGLATSVTNYLAQYGTDGEYNTITQYSGIQKSSLLVGTWFDGSAPPHNATDAAVQGEASRYIAAHGFDANAIYEVFLPSTSYSSDGTATSCGGPSLTYCAYHGNFNSGSMDVRYASMPYPSCSGCSSSGFTPAQNIEHFVSHETREAVTDPDGTGWWDRRGNEADDKCAWSPAPFVDSSTGTNADGSGFAYQYEWSNANSGCIKTR